MPDGSIRVGVVGLGQWGPNFLRNFETAPGAALTAIADSDIVRLDKVRAVYPRPRASLDARAVIEDPEVDAVVIATPTHTHYELARMALENGKHVLVEKPIAPSSRQALELGDLADRCGRTLLVGHVFLYNQAIRYLKDVIRSSEFGATLYLHSRRTNLGPVRSDVHAGWDLASHDISIFLFLLDEFPIEVTASAKSFIREGLPDVVFATLTFPSGVLAHLHTSWLDPQKVRDVTVVGTNEMVVFDDMKLAEPVRIYHRGFRRVEDGASQVVDSFGAFRVELVQGDVIIPSVSTGEPLRNECDAFLRAIRERRPPVADGRLGWAVVRVLEAIDRSIEQRNAVVPIDW